MLQAKTAFRPSQEISVPAMPLPVRTPAPRTRHPWVFLFLLMAFIVATRWPLAPKYLYYFDSANFALALEKFDPALHQPQPPGYPLFVALIRLIHFFVGAPEQVLLIAGLLAAFAATVLIYFLARDLYGANSGILAAALLASNPVFWFGGVTNQIRLFLAVIALGIGLLAWRALTRPDQPAWLYAAFAALGVAGGFRPGEAPLFIPLLAWVWWRTGRRLLPPLMTPLAALPWLAVTLSIVGGPARMLEIMGSYTGSQFGGTSWFYGAAPRAAWHMFLQAFAWYAFGPLLWMWAVCFLPWRPQRGIRRTRTLFLILAAAPPMLFSAFIHIGDPDQALAGVSILCLIGGGVMSAFLARIGSRRVYRAAILLVAAGAFLFFHPPYHLARAASIKAVRDVDRLTSSAIDTIAELRGAGPVTILHWGSPVASRQLEFYFPEDYVSVLPTVTYEQPMVFHRHSSIPLPGGISGLIHPASRRAICLVPTNAGSDILPGWRKAGPVYTLDTVPEAGLTLGPHHVAWDRE